MPLENGEYVFDISDWGFSEEARFLLETGVSFADLQECNRTVECCVASVMCGYQESDTELSAYLLFLLEVVGMLRMDMEEIRESMKLNDLSHCDKVIYLRTLWSAILRARLVADVGIWAWVNALTYKGIQLSEKEREKAGQLGLFLYPYLHPKGDSSSQKKSSVFPEILRLSESAIHCLKILNDAANGIKHPKTYNAWRSLRKEATVIFWPKGENKQPIIQHLDALIAGLYCFVLRLLVEMKEDVIQDSSSICVVTC